MSDGDFNRFVFRFIKSSADALMLTTTEKLVLLNFVDALNPEKNGTLAWPGEEEIAARWSVTERTVRRSVKRLCELDYLKLHRRTGRKVIYIVNVGLINRLIETGHSVRSEKQDRTESPVRPDIVSGQRGHPVRSDRTQCPPKYQGSPDEVPTEAPSVFSVGSSSNLREPDGPVQRRLALAGIVSQAADRMRASGAEVPTRKTTGREAEPEPPAGMPQVKERPG